MSFYGIELELQKILSSISNEPLTLKDLTSLARIQETLSSIPQLQSCLARKGRDTIQRCLKSQSLKSPVSSDYIENSFHQLINSVWERYKNVKNMFRMYSFNEPIKIDTLLKLITSEIWNVSEALLITRNNKFQHYGLVDKLDVTFQPEELFASLDLQFNMNENPKNFIELSQAASNKLKKHLRNSSSTTSFFAFKIELLENSHYIESNAYFILEVEDSQTELFLATTNDVLTSAFTARLLRNILKIYLRQSSGTLTPQILNKKGLKIKCELLAESLSFMQVQAPFISRGGFLLSREKISKAENTIHHILAKGFIVITLESNNNLNELSYAKIQGEFCSILERLQGELSFVHKESLYQKGLCLYVLSNSGEVLEAMYSFEAFKEEFKINPRLPSPGTPLACLLPNENLVSAIETKFISELQLGNAYLDFSIFYDRYKAIISNYSLCGTEPEQFALKIKIAGERQTRIVIDESELEESAAN